MAKAIVTLVVGEQHRTLWETCARASWETYAKRHGYKLVIVDQLIDKSEEGMERSPSWQKLLLWRLPELHDCDRVAWIDADIIINNDTAPDIVDSVPPEKIGAAVAHLILAYPGMESALARVCGTSTLAEHARWVYEQSSLPPFDYHLNAGVLVLSRSHQEFLEYIYETYPEQPKSYFEQMALSSESLQRGLHHALDPRFNAAWYEHKAAFYPFLYGAPSALLPLCLAVVYANNFFLHFCGTADDMKLFRPEIRIEGKATRVPPGVLHTMVDALHQAAMTVR